MLYARVGEDGQEFTSHKQVRAATRDFFLCDAPNIPGSADHEEGMVELLHYLAEAGPRFRKTCEAYAKLFGPEQVPASFPGGVSKQSVPRVANFVVSPDPAQGDGVNNYVFSKSELDRILF